ncbi:DUF4870 family protein [Halomonas cibimaris]|uniref:DUF4870 family protein n=1 Tax=Halomonas cibimaris TaxID=657012 RepID=A0ABP7LJF1_9GAMM
MTNLDTPYVNTRTPQIVYALFLGGIVTANVTLLIGVIIAYVYRKGAAPWLQAHYRYLIRTFWIGTLYFCAVFALSVFALGAILWPLLAVWLVVRCITGFIAVRRGLPPARPGSWLW